ncbi:hypothetical protein ColTof3_13505 [Colletotrichum tofieldiae]|nr:hypothetical protein ColTof3_13505 [Colletotrichum tofieldiae]
MHVQVALVSGNGVVGRTLRMFGVVGTAETGEKRRRRRRSSSSNGSTQLQTVERMRTNPPDEESVDGGPALLDEAGASRQDIGDCLTVCGCLGLVEEEYLQRLPP